MIEWSEAASFGSKAFAGRLDLTSVIVPDGVTVIGDSAFGKCYNLRQIHLPASLERIAERAFLGCIRLPEITIPDTVRSIGDMAFKSCESLEKLILPADLAYMGKWAFDSCFRIQSVVLPARLAKLGEGAFLRCAALQSIDADPGNSVYSANEGVLFNRDRTALFAYPEGRTDAGYRVPDSVIEISSSAFKNAVFLHDVSIPESVRQVGDWAFCGCTRLRRLLLPARLTGIGEGLCAGCVRLQDLLIPDQLSRIGDKAFSECRSLQRLVVPGRLTRIGARAFFGLHMVEIRHTREAILFPDWSRLTWEQANRFNACVTVDHDRTCIDYALYDQLFEQVLDVEDRFRMAVVQLRNPDRMSPDRQARYLDFLARHVEAGMKDSLERNDVEGVSLLLGHRLVSADDLAQLIETANTGHHAEIMMALLRYQRDQFGTKSLEYAL